MTFWEAAERVLRKSRQPLTTEEILRRAMAGGLETAGKTPSATLAAVLYRRAKLDSDLERVFETGPKRARRQSVKWRMRE
jgi:hypothetical protein